MDLGLLGTMLVAISVSVTVVCTLRDTFSLDVMLQCKRIHTFRHMIEIEIKSLLNFTGRHTLLKK